MNRTNTLFGELLFGEENMAGYGSGNDETIITDYLDSHLENGIKQKNLDLILDLIDEYVELKESQIIDK